MNYCIIHAQKLNKSDSQILNIIKHNTREKVPKNSNGVPPVSLTDPKSSKKILDEVNKKVVEIESKTGRKIRSDSVKLCQYTVTLSDAKNIDIKNYFEQAKFFLERELGAENVVSAVVHLDETTPHAHFLTMPITKDGRLSAKEIFGDRKKMQKFQDDFHAEVGSKFGLQRGVKDSFLSHEDLKSHRKKIILGKEILDSTKKNFKIGGKILVPESSLDNLTALAGQFLAQENEVQRVKKLAQNHEKRTLEEAEQKKLIEHSKRLLDENKSLFEAFERSKKETQRLKTQLDTIGTSYERAKIIVEKALKNEPLNGADRVLGKRMILTGNSKEIER